jgi:archaellum biogenesis ATPase FlaH
MAEYGDELSIGGSIRHAQNVKRIFGVELDYDGEQMSLTIAEAKLTEARVTAVLYTSPSHRPTAPRWRALFPLAEPALPEEREALVGRANRILGGVASRESFALSQSFYIGRVRGVEYDVAQTDGRCIDEALDVEPLFYVGQGGAGETRKDLTTDAELRAAFERGEDRYQAMLKLSARWAARGMAEDDIAAALDALFGDGSSLNADGVDLRARVPGMARTAVAKFGETRRSFYEPEDGPPPAEPPPWLNTDYEPGVSLPPEEEATAPKIVERRINWAGLAPETPPERSWAIKGWLGMGHVTLLAGPPGSGKTAFCQMLASALAIGADVIDDVPEKRTVLFWAGEDDRDELWRRQMAIARWMNLKLGAFDERLVMLPLDQEDLSLVGSTRDGLVATPRLKELREQIGDLKAEVVFIDSVARTFGGNENDRHEVTKFIAALQHAASPTGAAVCLIGHPAKGVGSEFSGSTAWEASVRARLYFGFEMPDRKGDDGDPVDPTSPIRYLAKRKTNYSTRDWRQAEWIDGVMTVKTPEPGQTFTHSARSKAALADEVVYLVRRLKAIGLDASHSTHAANYLPKAAKAAGLLNDSITPREVQIGLAECLANGRMKVGQIGTYSNRTPKLGLILADEALQ